MTWAYQQDSTKKEFANYNKDQMTMYNAIIDATESTILTNSSIAGVIPGGTAVQNARTSYVGDTLTRDGYHLSRPQGRYVAACTWLEAVLGVNPMGNTYCPEGMMPHECRMAQKAAHKAVKKPYKISEIK